MDDTVSILKVNGVVLIDAFPIWLIIVFMIIWNEVVISSYSSSIPIFPISGHIKGVYFFIHF